MGLFKTLRSMLGFRSPPAGGHAQMPPPRQSWQERREHQAADVLRRWDAGRTTRLNDGHWSGVSGQPINAALSSTLDNLRNRSEAEIANNPLLEGMISTYTLCALGSQGPTLKVMSSDTKYNQQREAVWANWAKQAGSNQQLGLVDIMRLWIRSLFAAGEFVDQLISVPDADGPVKMRLLPIHAHRLLTPPEFLGDHSVAMGVRRDLSNRRPVCYYVSQPYIMGAFEVYTGEFVEIPYRDLLHGFLMSEEDQVRGVPWLACTLDPIGEFRDYKASTLDAARAAADWGVYLYTESDEIPPLPAGQDNVNLDFERRQTRSMPPGWKPQQIQAQQPPANYEPFYKLLVQEIGRAVNMPLMMMLLDSSNHNYSSARFDGQLFWRGIEYTQGFLGRQLDRLEKEVCQEASIAWLSGDREGLLPPPAGPISIQWIWPRAPHVDPTKERQADRLGLENGDLTLTDLCARDNKDIAHVIAQRKRDQESLKEAGLPTIPGIPDPAKAAGSGASSNAADGGAGHQDDGWKQPSQRAAAVVPQVNGRLNGHLSGRPA